MSKRNHEHDLAPNTNRDSITVGGYTITQLAEGGYVIREGGVVVSGQPTKELAITWAREKEGEAPAASSPANDNAANMAPIAAPPAGGTPASLMAQTSIAAIQAALNGVDMSGVSGRSGHPTLLYKSREDAWMYGQKRTKPEPGSRWASNPASYQRGVVCFSDTGKRLGEYLRSVSEPMIDSTKLPDLGRPWQVQWAVNMKCLDGADAGVEVVYKANTDGGIQAISGQMNEVRDRINRGQHDGKISPIALLESGSYPHEQYGKTGIPLLTIVDWMPLNGPAPAPVAPTPPAPASPPTTEQPRRRRVA
jgi:hypothetical protein